MLAATMQPGNVHPEWAWPWLHLLLSARICGKSHWVPLSPLPPPPWALHLPLRWFWERHAPVCLSPVKCSPSICFHSNIAMAFKYPWRPQDGRQQSSLVFNMPVVLFKCGEAQMSLINGRMCMLFIYFLFSFLQCCLSKYHKKKKMSNKILYKC